MFFVSAMALFLAIWIRGDVGRPASDIVIFQRFQRDAPLSKFAATGLLAYIGVGFGVWILAVCILLRIYLW